MAYWLLKSEPSSYSWADLVRDRGTEWTGVRNYAAAINLRAMQMGDRALIYHSMTDKAAIGIAEITRTWQPDGDKGAFASIAIRPVEPLPTPVTLAAIKAEPRLAEMPLIRQSRLSVVPITGAQWAVLMEMAGQ